MFRSRLTPGTGQRRRSLTAPSFTKKACVIVAPRQSSGRHDRFSPSRLTMPSHKDGRASQFRGSSIQSNCSPSERTPCSLSPFDPFLAYARGAYRHGNPSMRIRPLSYRFDCSALDSFSSVLKASPARSTRSFIWILEKISRKPRALALVVAKGLFVLSRREACPAFYGFVSTLPRGVSAFACLLPGQIRPAPCKSNSHAPRNGRGKKARPQPSLHTLGKIHSG